MAIVGACVPNGRRKTFLSCFKNTIKEVRKRPREKVFSAITILACQCSKLKSLAGPVQSRSPFAMLQKVTTLCNNGVRIVILKCQITVVF